MDIHKLRKERLMELEINIQTGLVYLESIGVDRKDVVDAAQEFVDEILNCADKLCEGKGVNYLNADIVIAMIIFHAKATALGEVIGLLAADKGVDREIFEGEMQINLKDMVGKRLNVMVGKRLYEEKNSKN